MTRDEIESFMFEVLAKHPGDEEASVSEIADRWEKDASHAYVHRILDAWLNQAPLNFGRLKVPKDVQERLSEAVASVGWLQQIVAVWELE